MSDVHTSVAVIELEHSGHRLYFATLLANHLAQDGVDCVLVTSPESLESREGREYFPYLDKRVQIKLWLKSSGIKACTESYASDDRWAIVLDGESLLYQRSLPRVNSRRVICLMLHSPFLYPVQPTYSRPLKRALVARAEKRGFHILNLASPSVVLSKRSDIAADPSPFALLPPADRGCSVAPLDPNLLWIGLFGGLSERKGVKLMIEAVRKVKHANLGLLLAGRWHSPELKAEIVRLTEESGIAVEIQDEFITTDELRYQMSRVDVIAVFNRNEGSSGILLAGCSLRKSVILSGSVSLSRDAAALNVPWIQPRPDAVAGFLESNLKNLPDLPNYVPASDGRDFAQAFVRIIQPWR